MVLLPMEHFLRGISFDSSAFNKTSFSATAFIMPLFVPTPHLTLNFANRVRKREGGDRWDANMPLLIEELGEAIKKQAVPYLSSIQSLADFVTMAKQTSLKNPHTLRAIAFALALESESQEAINVIDDLISGLDTKSTWQVELGGIADNLKAELIENPAKAKQQLLDWEAETIRNFKLL